MLQRILVSLLAYLMAFYPIFGSLANAGAKENSAQHSAVSNKDGANTIDEATKVKLQETYGNIPLSFIQNNGQVDERVSFYEKGSGHATFFTKEGVYLSLVKGSKSQSALGGVIESEGQRKLPLPNGEKERITDNIDSALVKLTPIGANKNPQIIAQDKQEGKVNYFIGNDPNKWKTNIPTHGAVVYKEIYKNIDMKFYGNNKQMEYDIIVQPGADPNKVKLSYEGVEGLKVTKEGDLLISLKQGEIIQKKPYIYQDINGKRIEVEGMFTIHNNPPASPFKKGGLNGDLKMGEGGFAYGFQVASYNKNHPLIIDPAILYSTYLGGSSSDGGSGIAVDTSGNMFITGWTYSTDFPTASPIDGTCTGCSTAYPYSHDAFVAKISASGDSLIYSTYIGGSDRDAGFGIAVDISGNAYITGSTISLDFPTVSPIQRSSTSWDFDAFIAKIDATGSSLVYSTYLGGNGGDYGHDIVVDTSGNAYLTGMTDSLNFPLVNPIYGTLNGYGDAFVTKINSSGTALVYSTYLGGSNYDYSYGIAVDSLGNAYVTGQTLSTNFPTVSPIQSNLAGGSDAFVTKINASGSLVYSTYLGGSGGDGGSGIAVDSSGNAYIIGTTDSVDFPTLSALQGPYAGGGDIFIAEVNEVGKKLVYSTYLGGSGGDGGSGIAVDSSGNVYITGSTTSTDFPLTSPIDWTLDGDYDAFVTTTL